MNRELGSKKTPAEIQQAFCIQEGIWMLSRTKRTLKSSIQLEIYASDGNSVENFTQAPLWKVLIFYCLVPAGIGLG